MRKRESEGSYFSIHLVEINDSFFNPLVSRAGGWS